MLEFTGSMSITFEVTIRAKNRKEAESFFDGTYLNASIEPNKNPEVKGVKILSDNTDLDIEYNWEIKGNAEIEKILLIYEDLMDKRAKLDQRLADLDKQLADS